MPTLMLLLPVVLKDLKHTQSEWYRLPDLPASPSRAPTSDFEINNIGSDGQASFALWKNFMHFYIAKSCSEIKLSLLKRSL